MCVKTYVSSKLDSRLLCNAILFFVRRFRRGPSLSILGLGNSSHDGASRLTPSTNYNTPGMHLLVILFKKWPQLGRKLPHQKNF